MLQTCCWSNRTILSDKNNVLTEAFKDLTTSVKSLQEEIRKQVGNVIYSKIFLDSDSSMLHYVAYEYI